MSTIARLAINLAMQDDGVAKTVKDVQDKLVSLGVATVKANSLVSGTAAAWNMAKDAAVSYTKVVGGLLATTASIRGVSAAIKSLSSDSTSGIGRAFTSLKTAIDSANASFAAGFAKTANLEGFFNNLRGVVQKLQPVLNAIGQAMGIVFNIFSKVAPIIVLAAGLFKILAVVIGVALHMAITKLLVGMATYIIFGKWMSATTLLIAAAKKAATLATWLFTAALAALQAVGVPIWLAIGVAVGVVAAAIGIVVGTVWGLIKAWEWLSGTDNTAEQAANVAKLAEATEDATKDAREFIDAIKEANDTAGMTEREKKQHQFNQLLREASEALRAQNIAFDASQLQAQLKSQLNVADAIEKRAKITKTLRDLEKELAEVGVTAAMKAAAAIQKSGGSQVEIDRAFALGEQIELREKSVAMEKELKGIIEDSAYIGMTAIEKRLAQMKELGATAGQLAEVKGKLEGAEKAKALAEQQKKLADELNRIQDEGTSAFLSDTEKKIAALQKLGATQAQLDQARAALNRAESAKQAKSIIESTLTPMEKMRQEVEKINALRGQGALTAEQAEKALLNAKQKGLESLIKPKNAEQGGAVFKGSQADIAARFKEGPSAATEKQQLAEQQKMVMHLEKLVNKAEQGQVVQVAELN